MPQSRPEFLFELVLKSYRITYEKEYVFDPERKSRSEFAILDKKILIEIEGGSEMKLTTQSGHIIRGGRHNWGEGYRNDCEKYNRAAFQGWKLYRIPSQWITENSRGGKLNIKLHANAQKVVDYIRP